MVSFFRTRWFAVAAAVIAGIAALGAIAVAVARTQGNGDPDPEAGSEIAVCSDVPVHAWVSVNIGSEAQPDTKNVDYDLEVTGHARDPFDSDARLGCAMAGSAFGSRVDFRAPGLNNGQPFPVTAPADRRHVLTVRFTVNPDGTVTGTQDLVASPG